MCKTIIGAGISMFIIIITTPSVASRCDITYSVVYRLGSCLDELLYSVRTVLLTFRTELLLLLQRTGNTWTHGYISGSS
jgi:hypothetical protein